MTLEKGNGPQDIYTSASLIATDSRGTAGERVRLICLVVSAVSFVRLSIVYKLF